MLALDYVRSIIALRREVERGKIMPPIEARLAVPISEDTAESLLWFVDVPGLTAADVAWDIRRLFGDHGFDLFGTAAALLGGSDTESVDARGRVWAAADRPREPSDRLLIDLMDQAEAEGWSTPPDIAAAIERLRDAAEAARAERNRTDDLATEATMPFPLSAGTPGPDGLPLLAGQAAIVDLGRPIVEGFNAGQRGRAATGAPTLPAVMAAHPLQGALNLAIGHAVGLAERSPAAFRVAAVADMLGVLAAVHADTLAALVAHLRGLGCALPESKVALAVKRFELVVSHELRQARGFVTRVDGTPEPNDAQNLAVFLRLVGVETRFSVWKQREEIRREGGEWVPLSDAELNRLRAIASGDEHRFRPSKEFFRDMLTDHARQRSYDPVIDRIDACQAAWDGVPRLSTWLARVCGVPCDPYHQAVGRNLVGGIVRRARNPGCKHDETVILIGAQGCGKSTLCRILALNDEWFSDSLAFDGTPQNVVPQLFGKLVIELGELAAMARREIEFIKRFLVAQSDSLALKYQAFASDFARRCVFIGSTNAGNPLTDVTGNRRFLPVKIPAGFELDLAWLREHVDQLVGEAAHLEARGKTFGIPRDVWALAAEQQEEARAESALETQMETWFATKPADAFITAADLNHALTLAKMNPNDKALPALMRRFGFERAKVRLRDVGQARIWLRSSTGAHHIDCVPMVPCQMPNGRTEIRLSTRN